MSIIKEKPDLKDSIHQRIVDKFGSLSKFSRLSGYDRYELQKVFARKFNDQATLREIARLVKATANKSDSNEITEVQISKLSKALKKAGGVIQFSRDNPQFPEKSVYQILSGMRKRRTAKVMELFDHFELK